MLAAVQPAEAVGPFDGAHYYHRGCFRAQHDCKMRNLSVPFCRVCSEAITGGIGVAGPPQASYPKEQHTAYGLQRSGRAVFPHAPSGLCLGLVLDALLGKQRAELT
jgi:hypothetical protein